MGYEDKNDLFESEIITWRNKKYEAYKNRSRTLYDLLVDTEKKYSEKVFLIDEDNKIQCTFADILSKVNNFSAYLYYEHNIQEGDIVSGILFNSIEHIIAFLSLQKIGAVFLPIPTKYTLNEINKILRETKPKLTIVEKLDKYECSEILSLENEFEIKTDKYVVCPKLNYKGNEKNIGINMFTSGTTGISKAAVIRNFNMMHAVETYVRFFGLSEKSSTILAIPMYNITGLIGTFATFLRCGGTIFLMKKFDSTRILEIVDAKKIDFYHGSPTVLINLIQEAIKKKCIYDSVKLICCGSGNMTFENITLLKSIFINADFRVIYGLTETSSPCTIMPEDSLKSIKKGSCGKPIWGMQIKILTEEGGESEIGEQGEVVVKGTNVITEYFPQNFGLINSEGWLKTGDIGYLDKDGYLYIKDRKKDIINRGGEKIYCYEVENEIASIRQEKIKEVAVVAREDEFYGEVPVAVISTYDGGDLNIEYVKEVISTKIAKYKRPVQYYQVEELPKNANGKIDKKHLKILVKEWEKTYEK